MHARPQLYSWTQRARQRAGLHEGLRCCLRELRPQRLPGSCVRRAICGVCDLSSQAAFTAALSGLLSGLLRHAALTAALTAAVVLRLLRLGLRRICRILGSCDERGPGLSRGPRARRGGEGGFTEDLVLLSLRLGQEKPAIACARIRAWSRASRD